MNEQEKELQKELEEYAKSQGFVLNPNEKISQGIIKGLLKNKEKHGEIYCPCRVVTRNKKEDQKIICSCIYHLDEIAEKGNCFCGLFHKA